MRNSANQLICFTCDRPLKSWETGDQCEDCLGEAEDQAYRDNLGHCPFCGTLATEEHDQTECQSQVAEAYDQTMR